MSRVITTRTEIKNKALAVLACTQAGIAFREEGDQFIRFTAGELHNAILDLKTGNITGDTDHGHDDGLGGILRQHYSEVQFREEALKIGTTIDERLTDKEGNIILMWHMG